MIPLKEAREAFDDYTVREGFLRMIGRDLCTELVEARRLIEEFKELSKVYKIKIKDIEKATADFEEIARKLVRVLDAEEGGNELISNQGQALDGYSALYNFENIARKARELLKGKESKMEG